MPKDIRLIGLDLDNTALNSKKQMTPRVRDAIARAVGAGMVVLPATGRPLNSVSPQFLSIPGVRYALTSNGAKVYDTRTGGVLFSHCFTLDEALKILELSAGFDNITSAYIDGVAYMESFDFANLSDLYTEEVINYMRGSRTYVPNLRQKLEQNGGEVEKISLIFRGAGEREALLAACRAAGNCVVTSSMASNVELNAPGCDKGNALLALAKLLGLTGGQVMAVGDSTNDLGMLRAAGYSVAMGNSPPEVLAVADAVTKTADEDGAALAIEAVMPG
jgi:Cof subfamily protein (haloacid dehalogenase superfamily)